MMVIFRYIKEQLGSTELKTRFVLTSKGKYFLKNFDNSFSKKLDNYLGKYPNLGKLFYFILGIIIGLIPTAFKFIT